IFSTQSTDTQGNSTLAELITDINSAHSSTDFEAFDNAGSLGFRTVGTAYDVLLMEVSKNVYLGNGSIPIVADNPVDVATTFKFETDAFFTFGLPDGSLDAAQVLVEDTEDNLDLDDLVDDINDAIRATPGLMVNDAFQKVEAYIEDVGGNDHIAFRLNTTQVFPSGGDWNMQVNASYEASQTNGANFELGMLEQIFDDTQGALIGPYSGQLTAADTVLSNDFSVDVSVNGNDYQTVIVTAASTADNTSIGDLISDINAAFAAVTTTIQDPDNLGTFFTLDQFVKAITIGGSSLIQLAVIDADASDTAYIQNIRFAPTSTASNGYVDLGFSEEEARIGIRGSDATLDNIFLNGRAEVVDGDFSGTGAFGIAEFSFGNTDLDLVTDTTYSITGDNTRMVDIGRYLGAYGAEYSSTEINSSLSINGDTGANLQLQNLAFTADEVTGNTIGGLTFGAGATVDLFYRPTSENASSSIGVGTAQFSTDASDLSNLPVAGTTFTNTNDTHLLGRLTFNDIAYALWRVGDFISDWLNNDPNGPFAANLFFAKTGLVDVEDFGEEFRDAIIGIFANQPETLQEVQRAIESALNLDAGDVGLNLVTTGSGSTYNASLNIQFNFLTTFASTLPLYLDISMLADRNVNSGLVKQNLLGLSSLASNPVDPMEVELEGLSKLQLDMDIELVRDGTVIEPTPVLNQPSSGEFFETKFFVTGDSYTGDLPAGANRLRLGYSWFDETGREVLAPDTGAAVSSAAAATTGALSATYSDSAGTLTGTSAGELVLDGVTLTERDSSGAAGDYVLVKDQADSTQNGLYEVTTVGNGSTAFVLTRITDSIEWLKVEVASGASNGERLFLIKDVPNVDVAAAATTSVPGSYITQSYPFLNYIDAGNALTIDGVTPAHGDLVLLAGQHLGTTGAPNGLYQVQINGGVFELYLMDLGQGTLGQADVTGGTNGTGKSYFIDFNNITNHVTERLSTDLTPYDVVELNSAAVAVSEGGEVAMPDSNGTPHVYDTEETTTDEDDIAAADYTVVASTTEDLGGTYSSGSITLSGSAAPVIDGVTLVGGDLIMVNHQSDGSQNGIYQVVDLSGSWRLDRVSTYNDLSDTLNVKVAVSGGTAYGGFEFTMAETISEFDASIIRFSKLIKPASFVINLSDFDGTTSKQLPYTVTAATASDILVSGDGSSTATFSSNTITADQNGSLNSYVTSAW
ncbi:MAG: hypothetical protein AAF558_15085, partial [Verrucomicrobiota bacterium]